MTKKMSLGIMIVGFAIIAASIAIGFKDKAKKPKAFAEPIKIGFIGPLTGDAASYGEPYRNMIMLAVEEVKAMGGIGGRKLEVIYEDGKCSGKDAANAMQKLANIDKVQAVIGGFCSGESLAAQPIAAQHKILLFSAGSSSPDLTGISQYFVRNYPSDASQGKTLADAAAKKGWKSVAFMQEQTDYALGVFKAFSANFEGPDRKAVKEEFPSQTTDFRSFLTKLRSQNADALFIDTQTPAVAERILKQMQELKWRPQLLINDAISGDPAVVEKNAAVLEGAFTAEFGTDPANQKFQHMLAVYKNTYGAEPPFQSYAQTEYDAVYLLRDAISAVGNNGEQLSVWFRMVYNWDGASGKVTIGQDGDRAGGHSLRMVRSGKVMPYTE